MKLWTPWRKRRPKDTEADVEGELAHLARLKAQRGAVDELVIALVAERHLNNFSASLSATLRGDRP